MRPEIASDWIDGTTGDWQIPGDSAETNKASTRRLMPMKKLCNNSPRCSPLEYERVREAEAEKLGCRVTILDELVANRRPPSVSATGELQGRTLNLPDVEPWPEPVNGAEVLHEAAETCSLYVALPAGAADALALWCAARSRFRCVSMFATSQRHFAGKALRQEHAARCDRDASATSTAD